MNLSIVLSESSPSANLILSIMILSCAIIVMISSLPPIPTNSCKPVQEELPVLLFQLP